MFLTSLSSYNFGIYLFSTSHCGTDDRFLLKAVEGGVTKSFISAFLTSAPNLEGKGMTFTEGEALGMGGRGTNGLSCFSCFSISDGLICISPARSMSMSLELGLE